MYAEFSKQGCTRIFWSRRYVEFEEKEDALEYFSQVFTLNLSNKRALEYFGHAGT